MTKRELVRLLDQYHDDAEILFSVADDTTESPEQRWFADDVHETFLDGNELVICLVAESNNARQDKQK